MRIHCASCGRQVAVKLVSYGDGHVAVCPTCGGIAYSGVSKPVSGKCDSDMPCTHRQGDACDFDGKCGGQVELPEQLTRAEMVELIERNLYGRWTGEMTQADLEENTTGGRWK